MMAIGALLALVVATVGPAASSPSHERFVLRLAEKLTDDEEFSTQIDVGDEGPSVGDYFVLADDPIFVPDLSKQVGTAEGDCVTVKLQGPTFECDLTFLSNEGSTLTTEGPLDFSAGKATWAVTGGTERFKTARGQLRLDFSGGPVNFLTFELFL